jgi:signal transduction histidine kinase/ligand-binding sensor domain-containing protein
MVWVTSVEGVVPRRFWELVAAVLALALGLVAAPPAHALDPTRSIAQMHHRTYTHEDGLPPGATAIAQTPDGYIWVGTSSGLYRFDGARFERIGADRLLSAAITAVETSESGDLWIGYLTGGISRLRGDDIVNFPPEAGAPGFVGRIKAPGRGDEVWAFTMEGVSRLAGGTWRHMLGDAQTEVWAIERARGGVLWVKNGEHTYFCRPGADRCIVARGYAGGIMGFARDREGRVWTSDTHAPWRMYALPDIAGVPDTAIPRPAYGGRVSEQIRGRIMLDREGTLWNINLNHGLLRARSIADAADPHQLDAFNSENGLSHDFVQAMFEDREGNIWAATNRGLDQFRPANMVIERSIPTTASWWGHSAARIGDALYIHASTSDDNSSPDAGFRGPLYRVNANGAVETVISDMPGPWDMVGAPNGAIWLGTDHGLFSLVGGRLTGEPMPPEIAQRAVYGLFPRPGGSLWVWMRGGDVWERTPNGWRQLPELSNLSEAGLAGIAEDSEGSVWFTPDERHLFRYRNGRAERFAPNAGPNIGNLYVIAPTDHGVFFGGERGVSLFEGGRFHSLRSDRLSEFAFVNGIAEVGDDVWIGAQAGIIRISAKELVAALRAPNGPLPRNQVFDRQDGLPSIMQGGQSGPIFNTALPGADGRIWFVTGGGVAWIDPNNVVRNPLAPPVVIQSLTANGQTYRSPQSIRLPAGAGSLEIDYAALSFVEPSRVRFRYQLEGVDDDWVDPGERRQAFYTRLAPGTYMFRVIASNDAGVWNNTGATVTFSIAPTFLQSIWFKLLLALALIALLWAAYALRLRQERARLQGRFEARIAERERIARELHDTLLQGFQGLMLRFQAVANLLPPSGEARAALDESLDRADAVLLEGRARVRDLRVAKSANDLPEALVEAANGAIGGETPRFQLAVEGKLRPLHPAVAEEVVRIAEEAFRNSVQHAQAQSIEAFIAYERGGLKLIMRDDGVGMDGAIVASGERAGHFGLLGMRERASRIGGRITISSRAGAGADVVLFVPASAAYRDASSRMLGLWPGDQ